MFHKLLRKSAYFAILALTMYGGSKGQEMSSSTHSVATDEKQCIGNLKTIMKLIRLHLHHSGGVLGFPSDLTVLCGLARDPNVFICISDKEAHEPVKGKTCTTSYEVVNDPLSPGVAGTPAQRIAIVAEKRANHDGRRHVLFYDGSVGTFDTEEYSKLRENRFIVAEE